MGCFHKVLPNVDSAYVTFQNFTPESKNFTQTYLQYLQHYETLDSNDGNDDDGDGDDDHYYLYLTCATSASFQ